MSDKGIMIELHVDPSRLTTLAPLRRETAIVSPEQQADPFRRAVIVAPAEGEFHETAVFAQQELARLTGVVLPLVDEATLRLTEQLPANALALGHAANNELLRLMHYQGYLEDSYYRPEGVHVLSMHNPLGDGHNVLGVLALTPSSAREGVQALIGQLRERDGQWLLPGAVHLVDPPFETPDPAPLLAPLKT